MATANRIELIQLPNIPEVYPGDALAPLLLASLQKASLSLADRDVLVIAHKIASKSEGRIVDLNDVIPGREALTVAKELNKDPRKVQVVLDESLQIVRKRPPQSGAEGLIIAEHNVGFICANAGIDQSNISGEERVVLLPENPDASAEKLRLEIEGRTSKKIGLVITDTWGRPWRKSLIDFAIGVSGVPATESWIGKTDAEGQELKATSMAFADQLSAAAGMLMTKDKKCPAVLVRGLSWEGEPGCGRDIIREKEEDLFL